eukprot:CAMPEP_0197936026 /NCGR_PEP_ID=MMETSP1439-20131203/114279_1 /TAXON_ID=66791 /ORGANISM="Gonyaulax spinifera, Strain CCMP409" /LENGTH=41 /DNA_ID= /DNA_START= /DNA_END= /DNA_ORIENTATION=
MASMFASESKGRWPWITGNAGATFSSFEASCGCATGPQVLR